MTALEQQVVDREVQVIGPHAEPYRERSLRVKVDEQHLAPNLGERGAQVDRRGRLADATLLVAHRDDARRTVRAEGRWFRKFDERAAGRSHEFDALGQQGVGRHGGVVREGLGGVLGLPIYSVVSVFVHSPLQCTSFVGQPRADPDDLISALPGSRV